MQTRSLLAMLGWGACVAAVSGCSNTGLDVASTANADGAQNGGDMDAGSRRGDGGLPLRSVGGGAGDAALPNSAGTARSAPSDSSSVPRGAGLDEDAGPPSGMTGGSAGRLGDGSGVGQGGMGQGGTSQGGASAESSTSDGGRQWTDGGVESGSGALDPGPTACMLSANTATEASGCFCQGALVAHGDLLYRQAYGIEVFDVSDPDTPTLLRTVDETGVSDGDVVVFEEWLVSSVNVLPAINVYALGDPTMPVLTGTLELPTTGTPTGIELAVRDDLLFAAHRYGESTSVIQLLSLDGEGQPAIERSLQLDGQIRSMAPGEASLHVLIDLPPSDAPRQELQKLDLDGTVLAAFDTTRAGLVSSVVGEWLGASFLGGGGASSPTLAVVQWSGAAGTVVGTWTDPDALGASSLTFLSPGLLAVAGGNLDGRVSIIDVSEPTGLTLLGSVSVARTEHLATRDGDVYASGNDTLTAVAVSCD